MVRRNAAGSGDQFPSELELAVDHGTAGWAVFPVWGVIDGRCGCGRDHADDANSIGKHPLTCRECGLRHGFKHATRNPVIIRRWWEHHPHANIGGRTGDLFDVVDIDPRHGGALEETPANYRILHQGALLFETPRTRLHRSGGDGFHVVVEHSGLVTKGTEIAGGAVELKSVGGYVLLPGSHHRSGRDYAVVHDHPVLPLPAAVLARGGEASAAHDLPGRDRPGDQASPSGIFKSKTPEALPASIPAGSRWRIVQSTVGREWNKPEVTPEALRDLAIELHRRCEQPPGRPYTIAEALRSVAYVTGKPKRVHRGHSIRRQIHDLVSLVDRIQWRGVSGHNQRKLLLACLDIGRRANSLEIDLSDRKAGELIGTCRETAAKAKKALIAREFLSQPRAHGVGRARSYMLRSPDSKSVQTLSTQTASKDGALRGERLHAFTADQYRDGQGRLGTIGGLILAELDTGSTWRSVAALARALHLTRPTVSRKLQRMAASGLAIKTKQGWRRGSAALVLTYHRRDADMVLHRLERWLHAAELTANGYTRLLDAPTITEADWQRLRAERPGQQLAKLNKRIMAVANTAPAEFVAKLEFLPKATDKVRPLVPRLKTANPNAPEAITATIAGRDRESHAPNNGLFREGRRAG